ncbi:MAG: hypothetical protein Q8Q09_18320 [Deltaproteobacteria bacterium]|nr:hypothetical protein [Deltaproteobacteria bacterium]
MTSEGLSTGRAWWRVAYSVSSRMCGRGRCNLHAGAHFLATGIDASGSPLGDLWRIDGMTGQAVGYGNVLPSGGLPDLSFDDHGDGLVYAGGYVGTTWYRDLWIIRFTGDVANTAFVHDFAWDGLAPTEHYAVVADLEHGMFWAVPGSQLAGNPAPLGIYDLDAAGASLLSQQGSTSAARIASPSGSSVDLRRRTDDHAARTPRAAVIARPSTRARGGVRARDEGPQ